MRKTHVKLLFTTGKNKIKILINFLEQRMQCVYLTSSILGSIRISTGINLSKVFAKS